MDIETILAAEPKFPKPPPRQKKTKKQLRARRPAKKSQLDMTCLAIPKIIRVEDPNAYKKVKKLYCECCGKPARKRPHHIESVGSGGPDIKENQIQLCESCHTKAHTGEIKKPVLFLIVAKRERVDVVDLIEGVKQQCV